MGPGETKGHKWSNLEHDISALCMRCSFPNTPMCESIHGEKKSKINERKEDAPGSIELQVIERKWEPSVHVRVRLWLSLRPILRGCAAHVY